MKPYLGIVHKDAESAYGITFPDAPGCFSAADDLDDVFAMAEQAIAAWTDSMLANGLAIPPTRGLSEITAGADWTDSLASSAFLIAVPAPPSGARREAA
jgi:predicted RNase H-like HicB family nuclease